jgi:hypothetical protein
MTEANHLIKKAEGSRRKRKRKAKKRKKKRKNWRKKNALFL